MEYHITVLISEQHERIASFRNNVDRDVCLGAFEEAYPDADFSIEDD